MNYNGNYPFLGGKKGMYRQRTVPVASLPPNAAGLCEMHGNVWEWCADGFGRYDALLAVNPVAEPEAEASERVLRGGSWGDNAHYCRSAYRYADPSVKRYRFIGFRLARGPLPEGRAGARAEPGRAR